MQHKSDDSAQQDFRAWLETLSLSPEAMEAPVGDTIVPQGTIPAYPPTHEEESSTHALAELLPHGRSIQISGTIGQGGMGVILLAQQIALAREVAVKAPHPEVTDPEVVQALLREAWVMGMLEHPNIVPVHALGTDEEGRPMLVMKRIEGETWRAIMHGKAPLPRPFAHEDDAMRGHLEILMLLCQALHFAHSKRILHRDIKPDNVMIGAFGEVYLLDWGLAVSLRPSSLRFPLAREVCEIAGTPAYMAPEMAKGQGELFCEATDVYLLGSILHEIITGRPRHQGDNLFESLFSVFRAELYPYKEDVPKELVKICHKAMAPLPQDRFADPEALRQALADFLKYRHSNALAQESQLRLQELRVMLEESKDDDDRVASSLYNLLGQCRFGFQQALREWPQNTEATDGLQEAQTLMANHELEQGNLKAAAILIAGLPRFSPPLEARLSALQQASAQKQHEIERLKRLEFDFDAQLGASTRSRLAFVIAFVIVLIPLPVAILQQFGLVKPSPQASLLFVAIFIVLLGLGAFLGRHSLLQNRANRSIILAVLFAFVARLGARLTGMRLGLPIEKLFIFDLYLYFSITGLLSVSVDSRFAFLTALYLCAAALATWLFHASLLILSLSNISALCLMGLLWRKTKPSIPL